MEVSERHGLFHQSKTLAQIKGGQTLEFRNYCSKLLLVTVCYSLWGTESVLRGLKLNLQGLLGIFKNDRILYVLFLKMDDIFELVPSGIISPSNDIPDNLLELFDSLFFFVLFLLDIRLLLPLVLKIMLRHYDVISIIT